MNQIGTNYRLILIGSSHGELVGVIIDGFPANISIDQENIQSWLDKRKPGQSSVTTQRKESDKLLIKAGIFLGLTNGEPIVAFVQNTDVDATYYEEIKETPRPGHADYPAYIKYKGANDYRGGGRFSGRMTTGIVIAGAIARQLLNKHDIYIGAFTKEIGGITAVIDPSISDIKQYQVYENLTRVPLARQSPQFEEAITEAKSSGDSLGGIIECHILGLPIGVGEPFFDSLESKIAHIMFSIPAVKGIEFGSGFTAARMRGSEHNDQYYYDDQSGLVKTITNNAGGILGGLSNGMPIIFRVAFKPTSSILIHQTTIDKTTHQKTTLSVKGRHDPCIVPRAVPVVESAAACVILDLLLEGKFI